MMNILNDLANCDKTMLKFKDWYGSRFAVPFSKFITLNFQLQLGVFIDWLASMNIQIICDGDYYALCYVVRPVKEIVRYVKLESPDHNPVYLISDRANCDTVIDGYYKGLIHIITLLETPF